MAIRGFSINISNRLKPEQAVLFARWIGGANVVRNQKIRQYRSLLDAGQGQAIGQNYSEIRRNPNLPFLPELPVQILRNAASAVYSDVEACRKGLRKFPKIKGRHKKRSAIVTRELFLVEADTDGMALLSIFDCAKKHRRKVLTLKLPYPPSALANQYRISRQGRRFTLSGTYDDGQPEPSNEALLADLAHLPETQLRAQVTGVDLGIVRQIQTNDGLVLSYSETQKQALRDLAGKKAHLQRTLARKKRANGNKHRGCESNAQCTLKEKITTIDRKMGDIRDNLLHHASKQLAEHSRPLLAFEALNLRGMVKKAKPRGDGRRWQRNQAKAKSGLSRSLHHVAMGKLRTRATYKARALGKATVTVPAAGTSRVCHRCGSTHTRRPNQATFECLDGCGIMNADENASWNIAHRGVTLVLETAFADKAKTRKTIAPRREAKAKMPQASGETEPTSRYKSGANRAALASPNGSAPPRPTREEAGIRPHKRHASIMRSHNNGRQSPRDR